MPKQWRISRAYFLPRQADSGSVLSDAIPLPGARQSGKGVVGVYFSLHCNMVLQKRKMTPPALRENRQLPRQFAHGAATPSGLKVVAHQ
jgi:hypothetical protein